MNDPRIPQTRLTTQLTADTTQLAVAKINPEVDDHCEHAYLVGADKSGWALSVPLSAFPFLKEGEYVYASITLVRVKVEPVEAKRGALITPGLIDAAGRKLSS